MRRTFKIFLNLLLFLFSVCLIVIYYLLKDLTWYENREKPSKSEMIDSWKNHIEINNPNCKIYPYQGIYDYCNQYVINCFKNEESDLKNVIKILEYKKNIDKYYKFYWNEKYNHSWKVEKVNYDYLNNVSTLFDIYTLPQKFNNQYLIDSIKLYPSMSKFYQQDDFNDLEGVFKVNGMIILKNKSLNFTDLKNIEIITRKSVLVNKKSTINRFIIFSIEKKKIGEIIWYYSKGYRIKLNY